MTFASISRQTPGRTGRVLPTWSRNIFCENAALETALQVREVHGGKITAVTCGGTEAEEVLRKALALRADEGVLLESPVENPDPSFVARTLAAGIRKLLRVLMSCLLSAR